MLVFHNHGTFHAKKFSNLKQLYNWNKYQLNEQYSQVSEIPASNQKDHS